MLQVEMALNQEQQMGIAASTSSVNIQQQVLSTPVSAPQRSPLVSLLETRHQFQQVRTREPHQRRYTEQGLEYQISVKEKALSTAIKNWRRKAEDIERILADSEDRKELRCVRDELSVLMRAAEYAYEEYKVLIPESETNIDDTAGRHQDICRRVGERIREISIEEESNASRQSSRASSRSSGAMQMEAAARAAELTTQLKYCKIEQEIEEQQMKINQRHKQMTMERELAMVNAKLLAIQEEYGSDISSNEVEEVTIRSPDIHTEARHTATKYWRDVDATVADYKRSATMTMPITAVTASVVTNSVIDVMSESRTNACVSSFAPTSQYGNAPSFASGGLKIYPPTYQSALRSEASGGYYTSYQTPILSTGITPATQPIYPVTSTHLSYAEPADQERRSAWPNDESVNNLNDLARVISQQNQVARLPPPEPGVFTGNALEYNAWKRSFELLIERRRITPAEKLYYLRKYVGGEAKECIEGFLLECSDDAYFDAKARLDARFGDAFSVASAFRKKLHDWPKINNRDGTGIQKLSDFMKQCVSAMKTNANLHILNDSRENQAVLRKLPEWLVIRWSRVVQVCKDTTGMYPNFQKFSEFIENEARLACDPVTSFQALQGVQDTTMGSDKRRSRKEKRQAFLSKAVDDDGAKQTYVPKGQSDKKMQSKGQKSSDNSKMPSKKRPCFKCQKDHHINDCPEFLQESLEDRLKYAASNRLCYACLNPNHWSRKCKFRKRCKICDRRHPTSLHDDNRQAVKSNGTVPVVVSNLGFTGGNKSSMILPVYISHDDNKDKEVLIYALLDTQSDATFIAEDTCTQLGVDGPETHLLLSTLSADNQVMPCKKVTGLRIRGFDSSTVVPIHSAYTKKSIPANRKHIPSSDTAMKWPHLHRIANQLMPITDCQIGLLIGYDCPRALMPREVIPAPGDEAYAQRTDLGWGIVGVLDYNQIDDDEVTTHRIVTQEVVAPVDRKVVTFAVKRAKIKEIINPAELMNLIDADFSGASDVGDTKCSMEDRKFMTVLQNGIHRTDDGHFEMPLPFKEDEPSLPNNRCVAVKRLGGLKKRLLKDEVYRRDYTTFMTNMIDKGFAEKCSTEITPAKVWYIPHHGVYHPKKKKIRVVFDASSQHLNASLNESLLQGPDLTNALLGVLCRFRKEKIAISCDVEQMFYQFKVCERHRDYLRFLWWPGDNLDEPPIDYRMTVHLFGAKSSPGCANFGLKCAADYAEEECGSQAADFIRNDFYVDDGLTSVDAVEDAIELISSTQQVCARSGIRLHKFASNNDDVMEAVPVKDRAAELQNLDLLRSHDAVDVVERTLGIEWSIVHDVFQFKIVLKNRPATRRGILASVSAIYDPLGFISPVILQGRRILQDICKQQIDWDAPLPDEIVTRWEKWKEELFQLEDLHIPRCYKPEDFDRVKVIQLHHFSDASTTGYGQCSYLRIVDEANKVHCCLVMAKARVTPVKHVTIPRLELAAAVLSVKISEFLKKQLRYDDVEEYFWTDSTVVLGYINSDAKRFHVYVANRIQQIRDCTQPDQWHYVRSEDNPADYASRGMSADKLLKADMWLNGPSFLWMNPLMDTSIFPYVALDDPELKKVQVLASESQEVKESMLQRWSKCSSWGRLRRAVAHCLLYKRKLHFKVKSKYDPEVEEPAMTINVELLCQADIVIINSVQRAAFTEEISSLEHGPDSRLQKNSPLYKLDPFIDENGTLRVGGRLDKAHFSEELKHPIILPKHSHVTQLIAQFIHDKTHQGRGATVSHIREAGYWIIGCKGVVSRIIHKCVTCRRFRGKLQYQKMAPLPEDRLEETPPFTYCAVDYFGPFYIRVKRSDVARYGVLFTCMTSRAIHLEVADSLSTDAFINALRRFIAIRGPIRQLRSDRGTNFVGAKNELDREWAAMNHDNVKDFLLQQNCDYFDFNMNVPSASHMGGIWERQIRTVRGVLEPMLQKSGGQLDDDSLRTLLYEVMSIVNSRPLTTDDLSNPTSEILTPNHIITMKSKVVLPPPGNFQQTDVYSRKRWRRVQYLLNVFWSRWKLEYLSQLQSRQKWNTKQRNVSVGDVVILKEDESPRNRWPCAIVDEVYPSDDGNVRKVRVRMADSNIDKNGVRIKSQSILERPIHKCVVLVEKA